MSDKNAQLCRFCQSNMNNNMQYYCEECGASCCSECLNEEKFDYFICQDCDSKNVEIRDDGTKLCKECGNENVVWTTQRLKSCPKCHSHHIINIYEKKEELEQKFLELIKETRDFVQPIRSINIKLNSLRQRLKKARDPPIKCYHYPNMEAELLDLFKLYLYMKSSLLEKINIHFRQLSLNREYFFDIYRQPNSNIKIIQGILENLHRSFDSINEFTTQNINLIAEKMEKIDRNLQIVNKIEELFTTYKKFLNLADNEKPVYAIKTKLTNGLNSDDKFKKNNGILFITNYDLSFVHEYGILKKKQETIFKAPVDDLISVKERGRIFKKLMLAFSYGKYEFSLPAKTIPKIIEYILLARNFEENTIFDSFSANRLEKIELDLHDLISFIEQGINSFFSSKCQYNKKSTYTENRGYEVIHSYKNANGGYPHNQNKGHSHQWTQQPSQEPPSYHASAHGQNWRNDYQEKDYYSQNIYNPYNYQNYAPQSYEEPQYSNRRPSYNQHAPYDERNILMKKLEKSQKYGQPMPPQEAPVGIGGLFGENPVKKPDYQEFNKNHLSDMFNSNNYANNSAYNSPNNSYEYSDNKQEKLMNLKKEKYGLKQTLKKLDAKFDQGIISEVDYFRTFKNLQKDIYLIESKMNALSANIDEEQSVRRNNKYFS